MTKIISKKSVAVGVPMYIIKYLYKGKEYTKYVIAGGVAFSWHKRKRNKKSVHKKYLNFEEVLELFNDSIEYDHSEEYLDMLSSPDFLLLSAELSEVISHSK